MCAKVNPNCVSKDSLPKVLWGFGKILHFQKRSLLGLWPKAADACQGPDSQPFPRGVQTLFTKLPPCQIPQILDNAPVIYKRGPFQLFAEAFPALPPLVSRPPRWALKVAKLFSRGLLQLPRIPHGLQKRFPPSASQRPPKSFPEAPPHAPCPPRGGFLGDPRLPHPRPPKFPSELDSRQLTTASSLSVLGATSPGNLMMGDGAAAARPNRQPRTQSARSGPASAPRGPRASAIALPGCARRPEVGRSVRAVALPPGWRLLRRAALGGAARLGGLGGARLSGAWPGPAPQPRAPAPRRRPLPPAPAAPLYV